MSGGQPEPELEEFKINFTYNEKLHNIIIKKHKTDQKWGSQSNYSLKVNGPNDESILAIEPAEPGIEVFIHALFDKKQINQDLIPFLNVKECLKSHPDHTIHQLMEKFIEEADKQLIREEIIKNIIKINTETLKNFKKLKDRVKQYNDKESTNKTINEWSIQLSPEESKWYVPFNDNPDKSTSYDPNKNVLFCYGTTTKCKIIKEYFGDEKQSRYYIMPYLEINDFEKTTREKFYTNSTYGPDKTTYDTIKPGKEDEVKKINSKLSSLKLFVRNGEDDFINQQYIGYEYTYAEGLKGFLKKIMKTKPPQAFSKLKERYDQLEAEQEAKLKAEQDIQEAAKAKAEHQLRLHEYPSKRYDTSKFWSNR